MSIKSVTTTTYTCDNCKDKIDPHTHWVDAQEHGGVIFHAVCWVKMGGPRVAKLLDLDDIFWAGSHPNRLKPAWEPR